jgi:hypothetical protein
VLKGGVGDETASGEVMLMEMVGDECCQFEDVGHLWHPVLECKVGRSEKERELRIETGERGPLL